MPGLVRPADDERGSLLSYLAQQRAVIRNSVHGITDEQAAATPSASALSLGGLLKHVAYMERGWVDRIVRSDREDDYHETFHFASDDTVAGVLAFYEEVAGRTEKVIAEVDDLAQPVPVPKGQPWLPDDVDAWSVRWVLLHIIEETARHAGHADIVRESLDGATAFPLMAAVEGWPDTPWMTKWRPKADAGT
jgi:uncharacterized damage-inducible protein DinB